MISRADHHSLTSPTLGEGGLATKREGGFSGPKDKPDTDSEPYLTMQHMS